MCVGAAVSVLDVLNIASSVVVYSVVVYSVVVYSVVVYSVVVYLVVVAVHLLLPNRVLNDHT